MIPFTIYVPGVPRPQPRPRFIKGRVVSLASGKAQLWKSRVMDECRGWLALDGSARVDAPVAVMMTFWFPTEDEARVGKPHTHRPDKDNLEKLVLDAMVRSGVLKDDALVVSGSTTKLWGYQGGVTITVSGFNAKRHVSSMGSEDDLGAFEV